MIYFIIILLFLTRLVLPYLGSEPLYWLVDGIFIGCIGVYAFNKSEKTVPKLIVCFFILLLSCNQIINNLFMLLQDDSYIHYLPTLLKGAAIMGLFICIFHNRYNWRKQKSVEYDFNKVQAIYSKPKTILTLIGATVLLSSKCSVKYSYNGQTIRFKKPIQFPILCDTTIKNSDIIENIDFPGEDFINRFKEIEYKKYNLLTFNCKSLLKN